MSRVTVRGNVSGTGTFTIESPNSNNSRTLVLPDNDGVLLSTNSSLVIPRGIPLFSVFQSVAQSIGNAYTKVNFQSVEVDTNNWFNTTTSRYTPQIAGWYRLSGSVNVLSVAATVTAGIFKNDALAKQGTNIAANAGNGLATALIYFNGSTDFADFRVIFGSTQNVSAQASTAYFQGELVRAD